MKKAPVAASTATTVMCTRREREEEAEDDEAEAEDEAETASTATSVRSIAPTEDETRSSEAGGRCMRSGSVLSARATINDDDDAADEAEAESSAAGSVALV